MIDKKEAFRFKYDTSSLNKLENNQRGITYLLYFNALLYYFICIVCPLLFAKDCGGGIDMVSHSIYGYYSIINLITEVYLVLKIEREVNNANILQFNKWHLVELVMGQIARLDFYTDICFLVLLGKCDSWEFFIPVLGSICMM
jgi:hypothetical protein